MGNNPKFWQLQKAANLTNQQCADWLGVTKRSICKWRSGENETPKAVMLAMKYRIKHGDITCE